jgi:hypothetical protein
MFLIDNHGHQEVLSMRIRKLLAATMIGGAVRDPDGAGPTGAGVANASAKAL